MQNKEENKNILKKTVIIVGTFLLWFGYLTAFFFISVYILKNTTKEIADLILEYLKVIIWPTVVVIACYNFRTNIAKLIDRFEEGQTPFGKYKFNHGNVSQQEKRDLKVKDEIVISNNDPQFNEVIKSQNIPDKKIEELEINNDQLSKELLNYRIELEFERIYNIIFRSQIDLLSKISTFDHFGLEFALNHFQQEQAVVNGLKEWNLDKYLDFLYRNDLISNKDSHTIGLTEKGRAFLHYLSIMGYQKYGI